MPIIGPLNYISIGDIYFAKELFALVQRVKIYTTYLIGTNSIEAKSSSKVKDMVDPDKYLASLNSYGESYFMPVERESDCLYSKFDLIGPDKENDDIIIPNYECVIDNIEEIYENTLSIGASQYYQFKDERTAVLNNICHNNCHERCFGGTQYDCTCNYINE